MSAELLVAEIGERLTWALSQVGVSNRKVAARVGVSHGYVSLVANAKSMPSIQMLVGLRREFDVSLHWLLLGEGEPFLARGDESSVPLRPHQHLEDVLLPAVLALGPGAREHIEHLLETILVLAQERKAG